MNHSAAQEARERLLAGGRLLITRLRHIGDVVLTLPLVQMLRRSFPEAELHYLAEAAPLQVLLGNPQIDRLWTAEHGALKTLRLMHDLRRQEFAAAIDLFSNPRSALLVRVSGAPLRVGEARRLRRRLYTVQLRPQPGWNAMQQHLATAQVFGLPPIEVTAPEIRLREDERQRGVAHLRALGTAGPVVLMHLDATHPAKEWPHDQVIECIQRLRRDGFCIVLTTAPERPEASRRVAESLREQVALLPSMPLRELFGVLSAVQAVISVDGGIMHASVALGRPTVALLGPTDPKIWFPYADLGPFRCLHAGLDCSNCDREQCQSRDCMRALAAADVVQALLDVLEAARCSSGTRFS